jgi:hypothetical protein
MDNNNYSGFIDSTETLREKRRSIGSKTAIGGFKNEVFSRSKSPLLERNYLKLKYEEFKT